MRGLRNLKRPDEKYVTERAYDNPNSSRTPVRDVAVTLNKDERVRAYVVESRISVDSQSLGVCEIEHEQRDGAVAPSLGSRLRSKRKTPSRRFADAQSCCAETPG